MPPPFAPIVAYLDPGTGSFVLQVLVAGLLSGLYVAGQSWARIKAAVTSPLTKKRA